MSSNTLDGEGSVHNRRIEHKLLIREKMHDLFYLNSLFTLISLASYETPADESYE